MVNAVIINSLKIEVQVSLLNKMHHSLSIVDVRDVLAYLPSPYEDIATFGKSPKLEDNDGNRNLAEWLDARHVISSFNETLLGGWIKINTFRKNGN